MSLWSFKSSQSYEYLNIHNSINFLLSLFLIKVYYKSRDNKRLFRRFSRIQPNSFFL